MNPVGVTYYSRMRKRPVRWSGEFNRLGTNKPRRGDILIAGCVSVRLDGAVNLIDWEQINPVGVIYYSRMR